MSELDLDCWQHKLGMVEGCLRAYSAPQEVMSALQWMKQNIEAEDGQPGASAGGTPRPGMVDLETMAVTASKRAEKAAKEPIPLTPSKDEMEARARGYTAEDEALIIRLLREGASIATIADHFPKKAYNTIYAKVTALKSSGRV